MQTVCVLIDADYAHKLRPVVVILQYVVFTHSCILLGASASAGESFYFMAYFSQLGGLLPGYYMFKPGQGNATAAAAQMAQLKAGGMDGVVIITNSLDFFVGE